MNLSNVSDKELLKKFKTGDNHSLEVLIARYKDKIYTSIYLLVKDTYLAEDIFQDTFIKVIATIRRGAYKEEGKFLPWVLRIAHNLCIDYFRKTARAPRITNSEGFDIFDIIPFEGDNVEDKLMKDQTGSKLKSVVESLPKEQREVVVLRHYANLSFKEISKIMNVSINTSLGRMRYALINMRKTIEEKQIAL